MKLLRPAPKPVEWSHEVECTGRGNGDRGCKAHWLAEKSDLFKTCTMGDYDGTREWAVAFKCPACGEMTNLGPYPTTELFSGIPSSVLDNLMPLRAWEAHQARASEAEASGSIPPIAGGTLTIGHVELARLFEGARLALHGRYGATFERGWIKPHDIDDAVNGLFKSVVEAAKAPTADPAAYGRENDRAAIRVAPPVVPETRTPAGDRLREAIREIDRAYLHDDDAQYRELIAAADAYDALPASQPRTTVEEFCSTEEGAALFAQEAAALAASEAVAARVVVDRAALQELRDAAWGMWRIPVLTRSEITTARDRLARAVDAIDDFLSLPAPEA